MVKGLIILFIQHPLFLNICFVYLKELEREAEKKRDRDRERERNLLSTSSQESGGMGFCGNFKLENSYVQVWLLP